MENNPDNMRPVFRFFTITSILLLTGCYLVNANILVLNGLTHEIQLNPGEKSKQGIMVQNASQKETAIRIYQTDYWFSYLGESKYENPGINKRSNASWIKVNQFFVTLKPQESLTIDFEVTVPSSDTLKGSYWSVIMLEGVASPDSSRRTNAISLSTVVRYAIQVITNIGETGTRDLQFLHSGVRKESDEIQFVVDMANTGERAVRPEVGIELFDSAGASVGIFKTDRKRIYPGTSVRVIIKLPDLKSGDYSGVLIADCDEDHIFGSNVILKL